MSKRDAGNVETRKLGFKHGGVVYLSDSFAILKDKVLELGAHRIGGEPGTGVDIRKVIEPVDQQALNALAIDYPIEYLDGGDGVARNTEEENVETKPAAPPAPVTKERFVDGLYVIQSGPYAGPEIRRITRLERANRAAYLAETLGQRAIGFVVPEELREPTDQETRAIVSGITLTVFDPRTAAALEAEAARHAEEAARDERTARENQAFEAGLRFGILAVYQNRDERISRGALQLAAQNAASDHGWNERYESEERLDAVQAGIREATQSTKRAIAALDLALLIRWEEGNKPAGERYEEGWLLSGLNKLDGHELFYCLTRNDELGDDEIEPAEGTAGYNLATAIRQDAVARLGERARRLLVDGDQLAEETFVEIGDRIDQQERARKAAGLPRLEAQIGSTPEGELWIGAPTEAPGVTVGEALDSGLFGAPDEPASALAVLEEKYGDHPLRPEPKPRRLIDTGSPALDPGEFAGWQFVTREGAVQGFETGFDAVEALVKQAAADGLRVEIEPASVEGAVWLRAFVREEA